MFTVKVTKLTKMIWLILIALSGGLAWYHFVRPMQTFKKLGIKQANPWPFFGDQWLTVFKYLSFFEFIEHIYEMFPDTRYSGFYQFNIPTLMLKDPELIKQITVKDFEHFTDHRPFIDPESDPFFGGNLFALKGNRWREMRATLSGSFTSSKMKNLFHMMNETAKTFTQFFLNKNQEVLEVELKETYTKYTNDIIATTAFGIKVDSLVEPNNDFYIMGKKTTNLGTLKMKLKFFGNFVAPGLFKALRIQFFDKDISNFFSNVIDETIKAREEQGIVRQDMIHLLLETRKGVKMGETEITGTSSAATEESTNISKFKQVKNLTNAEITSQALLFFFAGFDTISTGMCFGSYELALNKNIQERLRQEILEKHQNNEGKLTYDELLKMKYLDMVVSEILRKWPPGSGVDRVVTKPYTIEATTPDEKPVNLKKGDIVFLPIVGLHRDPKYFPDPEKFDPERFSDENKGSINPYAYIPFGSGPRNCIGSRFALLEIKVLLYHLLLNFEIIPVQKTAIPFKFDRNQFNPTAEGGFWLGFKRIK